MLVNLASWATTNAHLVPWSYGAHDWSLADAMIYTSLPSDMADSWARFGLALIHPSRDEAALLPHPANRTDGRDGDTVCLLLGIGTLDSHQSGPWPGHLLRIDSVYWSLIN